MDYSKKLLLVVGQYFPDTPYLCSLFERGKK